MAKKTQGSQLYIIDPVGPSVLEIGCVLSVDGIDTTNEQRETTCLSSLARTYEAGLATPGQATFGLNTDTSDPSHIRLHALKVAGTTLKFALGWSDGIDVLPTIGKPVDSVTISNGGTGYTTLPTVAFTAAPAGGITATGVAVKNGSNVITSVTITNPGAGYLSAPTVSFTGGGGTGAAGTAVLGDDELVPVTTRSWLLFDGYLANFPFSFQQNANVQSTVGVQISGEPELHAKV